MSISELMNQDRLEISQLFGLVNTRYVGKEEIVIFDPQFLSFFNVNTLDDLKKTKELLKQREHHFVI